MDVIHPQRQLERWTPTNDLFLQQTITKKWNSLRLTQWVRCWCQQENQSAILEKEVRSLVLLFFFFLLKERFISTSRVQ